MYLKKGQCKVKQGRLNSIIGPREMQCTGTLLRQPLTGIIM